MEHVIIGIDPGTKTGIAIWNPHKQEFGIIRSMKIHEALEVVATFKNFGVEVYCEDPTTWVPFKKGKGDSSRMQGAGSIKRDFRIWKDFCEDNGIPFHPVGLHKVKKKISAEYFQRLSGWSGRTCEHGRDAAMLVIGKRVLK